MSKEIPIDDVQDVLDLLTELEAWVKERYDRMDPLTATMVLISEGAYICAKHAVDQTDISKIIIDAVQLGIGRVTREKDLLNASNREDKSE